MLEIKKKKKVHSGISELYTDLLDFGGDKWGRLETRGISLCCFIKSREREEENSSDVCQQIA